MNWLRLIETAVLKNLPNKLDGNIEEPYEMSERFKLVQNVKQIRF